VQRIPYCGGNTNTTGGLRLARTEIFNAANGDRSGVPNVLVLITDGNPTREVDQLDGEANTIKGLNVRIVGVGVTNRVSSLQTFLLLLFQTGRLYAIQLDLRYVTFYESNVYD